MKALTVLLALLAGASPLSAQIRGRAVGVYCVYCGNQPYPHNCPRMRGRGSSSSSSPGLPSGSSEAAAALGASLGDLMVEMMRRGAQERADAVRAAQAREAELRAADRLRRERLAEARRRLADALGREWAKSAAEWHSLVEGVFDPIPRPAAQDFAKFGGDPETVLAALPVPEIERDVAGAWPRVGSTSLSPGLEPYLGADTVDLRAMESGAVDPEFLRQGAIRAQETRHIASVLRHLDSLPDLPWAAHVDLLRAEQALMGGHDVGQLTTARQVALYYYGREMGVEAMPGALRQNPYLGWFGPDDRSLDLSPSGKPGFLRGLVRPLEGHLAHTAAIHDVWGILPAHDYSPSTRGVQGPFHLAGHWESWKAGGSLYRRYRLGMGD